MPRTRSVQVIYARLLTSRNKARLLSALSVDHHNHPPQCVHAQRDEALLTNGIRILHGAAHRIAQCLFRVRKADTVFAQVGAGFDWVELDGHSDCMHTICIFRNRPHRSARDGAQDRNPRCLAT